MGDLAEFSLPTRLFLKAYPWRRIHPVPQAALKKPLSQSRLALVSSAGFIAPGQEPFDSSVRGGDFSFRQIPSDIQVTNLIETHRSESFDHTGIQQDPNLAFPIDRARELVRSGRVGSLNHRHLSFMGSITAPGRLTKETAPEAARWLVADQVDAALLVPVWPMCNQAVCLVAAELERQGICTVVIQLLKVVAEKVQPPRALFVPFRHGYPLETPDNPERQHAVIEAALKLLEDRTTVPPVLVAYQPDAGK
jgi:D-proline reductase (dithiol) PrdB